MPATWSDPTSRRRCGCCRRHSPRVASIWTARPSSCPIWSWRSEEHTSELQSLMRISYAVFCLKKKKTHHKQTTKKTSSNNLYNTLHLITYQKIIDHIYNTLNNQIHVHTPTT